MCCFSSFAGSTSSCDFVIAFFHSINWMWMPLKWIYCRFWRMIIQLDKICSFRIEILNLIPEFENDKFYIRLELMHWLFVILFPAFLKTSLSRKFALLCQASHTKWAPLPIPNASQCMLHIQYMHVKACVYDSYYHERIITRTVRGWKC